MKAALCTSFFVSIASGVLAQPPGVTRAEYGADISFPMTVEEASTNYAWLPHNIDPAANPVPEEYKGMPVQPLGDMQDKFEGYIEGCAEYYGKKGERCYDNEEQRIDMTRRQPASMQNYTEMGFAKVKAPEHVYKLLREFWEANKDRQKEEAWPTANIYVNHWESPSYMVSVEDSSLEGGGYVLKQHIWNAARDTISEWTGQQLAECSLYGIRVYTEGAVLSPHVDRLPLVSSAIINVDQDVDEPWPLEVIGHDGRAWNVTMEPGDMVLYESHSVIHGRPFPLKGRYFANCFIHFEPIGPLGGQVHVDGNLPKYVIPGSPEEANWRRQNPGGHKLLGSNSFTTGSTEAHRHASAGNFDLLRDVVDRHPNIVNVPDKNGWTALHEAVRLGDVDMVRFLLDRGADLNARVADGYGGNAVFIASQSFDEDHPLFALFEERGGKMIRPTPKPKDLEL